VLCLTATFTGMSAMRLIAGMGHAR
jgi:hypothetical protein